MSLFSRKKAVFNQGANNDVPIPTGQYDEMDCVVSVSQDGQRHSLEAEGIVRFYDDQIIVFAKGMGAAFKEAMIGGLISPVKHKEQIRFAYTDISRAFFPKKRTARIELNDGRYVFFVLNFMNLDRFTALLSNHRIAYEPFEKA